MQSSVLRKLDTFRLVALVVLVINLVQEPELFRTAERMMIEIANGVALLASPDQAHLAYQATMLAQALVLVLVVASLVAGSLRVLRSIRDAFAGAKRRMERAELETARARQPSPRVATPEPSTRVATAAVRRGTAPAPRQAYTPAARSRVVSPRVEPGRGLLMFLLLAGLVIAGMVLTSR